mmetsp:Transcript_10148/g.21494  ORF Transcript_10148/g.21494 Transcript_10148/m.21494 type:complete len:84 (+) Transcript_10148:531-782(+)
MPGGILSKRMAIELFNTPTVDQRTSTQKPSVKIGSTMCHSGFHQIAIPDINCIMKVRDSQIESRKCVVNNRYREKAPMGDYET